VVGFTTGSRGEVPGKKENLRQEMVMMMIIIMIMVITINSNNNYYAIVFKRGEVREDWRKFHNKELQNLYFSQKSMKWGGHVQMHGGDEMHTKFSSKNLNGKDHLAVAGIDVRIILK
jgi:hypothetical protein